MQIPEHMPRIETWKEWAETRLSTSAYGEHLDATTDICDCLEEIINKTKDFEDLKQQLTAFVADRKKFVNYANNNML